MIDWVLKARSGLRKFLNKTYLVQINFAESTKPLFGYSFLDVIFKKINEI